MIVDFWVRPTNDVTSKYIIRKADPLVVQKWDKFNNNNNNNSDDEEEEEKEEGAPNLWKIMKCLIHILCNEDINHSF